MPTPSEKQRAEKSPLARASLNKKTSLEVVPGRNITLNNPLELVTRVERDHIASLDRDGLASSRVAAGSGGLASDIEVPEARHLDVVSRHQGTVNDVEEGFDHVLGFTLVETETLEQQLGQFRLGQRGRLQRGKQHHAVRSFVRWSGGHSAVSVSTTQAYAELGLKGAQHRCFDGFDAFIGQGRSVIEHLQANGKAALTCSHVRRSSRRLVDVE
jgi:hypothetical protein